MGCNKNMGIILFVINIFSLVLIVILKNIFVYVPIELWLSRVTAYDVYSLKIQKKNSGYSFNELLVYFDYWDQIKCVDT